MESKLLAQTCARLADNKKAENITLLDLRELSSVADYFVIATGSNEPHLRAIVDEITEKLRLDHDVRPFSTEGARVTPWVVLDFIDVIVHVMNEEFRELYDLENDPEELHNVFSEHPDVAVDLRVRMNARLSGELV